MTVLHQQCRERRPLLILAPWPICIFLIDCFKVDISAWICSIVPGINARTALWLPSLDIKFLATLIALHLTLVSK